MQVHVNTDESVQGSEGLSRHASETVKKILDRFGDEITRVELHLSDQNGPRGGEADKRCLIEARLAGHDPLAVSETAHSLHQAIDGAARKLRRSLESLYGRLEDTRRRASVPTPEP